MTTQTKDTLPLKVPLKEKRAQCWQAKDTYFACLDRHNIISTRQPSMKSLMKSANNPFHRQMNNLKPTETLKPEPPLDPSELRRQLPNECQSLMDAFRSHCLGSWVQHFEAMREKEAVVKELERMGARPLSEATATIKQS